MANFTRIALLVFFMAGAVSAQAQDASTTSAASTTQAAVDADTDAQMHAMQTEIGEGKRAFVETQLVLTPEQAAKFWPIYDGHQAALAKLNQRRLDNLQAYAKVWNADTVDDAAALKLANEALAIDTAEAALMVNTFGKLKKAVPVVQAVHYLQVESKLRAIVRYELAAQVPYVK